MAPCSYMTYVGSKNLNFNGPTVGILGFAPLNARERIVEILRGFADLEIVDDIILVAVGKLTDRRNDGGGAAAPSFFQLAAFQCFDQFIDGEQAFFNGDAFILQKLDAGFAGNAGEDGACQLGGDDGSVDLEHDVHCADLFNVFTFYAVQPENLREALLFRDLACAVARRVVAAAFGITRAAADRADVL